MARSSSVAMRLLVAALICLPVTVVAMSSIIAPAFGKSRVRYLHLPLGFSLPGSNGYRIEVFRSSPNRVGLLADHLVHGREASAFYDAPGSFDKSTQTLEAQFGSLGNLHMTFHRQGKRLLHLHCASGTYLFATGTFSGTFSFTGEDGYTSATADQAPAVAFPKFFTRVLCAGEGRTVGSGPGAELDAWERPRSSDRLDFNVSKNKPTAKAEFGASIRETEGEMQIERGVGTFGPASSFTHSRKLTKAVVRNPPQPFSGEAIFKQGPGKSRKWTGTLTASFPGEANVPLAGAAFGAHLYAFRAG